MQIKGRLFLLLALVGGWVDAVGFLVLLHLFTGHMSGNSIAMTVYLGEGVWDKAFQRAFPIPLFVLGIALGTALIHVLANRGVRSVFVAPLTLEALLLLLFVAQGNPVLTPDGIPTEPAWRFYLLAALPALAMGLQNATLRRAGGQTIRTTYISGLLTDLTEAAVVYGFGRFGRTLVTPDEPRHTSPRKVFLLLGVWLAYVAGGCLGALTEQHWQLWSLAIPAGCLCIVIGVDFRWPLSPGLQPAED